MRDKNKNFWKSKTKLGKFKRDQKHIFKFILVPICKNVCFGSCISPLLK